MKQYHNEKNGVKYLNFNASSLAFWDVEWPDIIEELEPRDHGVGWMNKIFGDKCKKTMTKDYRSIKHFINKRTKILSRFCVDRDRYNDIISIDFHNLPNLWIPIQNGFVHGKDTTKSNLIFSNNFITCIIYNFISKERKLPSVENCPNWLEYPGVWPGYFDWVSQLEMSRFRFVDESIIDCNISRHDEAQVTQQSIDDEMCELFNRFKDDVRNGNISKVPTPGYFYMESDNSKYLSNLLVCGFIARDMSNRKNCPFFTVNHLRNIIEKYYGFDTCHKCMVKQFYFAGDIWTDDRFCYSYNFRNDRFRLDYDFGDEDLMPFGGIEFSKSKLHIDLQYTNCGDCGRLLEREYSVKWIGTHCDKSIDNNKNDLNMVLRFGIKVEKTTDKRWCWNAEYDNCHYVDIVCIRQSKRRKFHCIDNCDKSKVIATYTNKSGGDLDKIIDISDFYLKQNDLFKMQIKMDENKKNINVVYHKNGQQATQDATLKVRFNHLLPDDITAFVEFIPINKEPSVNFCNSYVLYDFN